MLRDLHGIEIIHETLDTINHTLTCSIKIIHTSQILSFSTVMGEQSGNNLGLFLIYHTIAFFNGVPLSQNQMLVCSVLFKGSLFLHPPPHLYYLPFQSHQQAFLRPVM